MTKFTVDSFATEQKIWTVIWEAQRQAESEIRKARKHNQDKTDIFWTDHAKHFATVLDAANVLDDRDNYRTDYSLPKMTIACSGYDDYQQTIRAVIVGHRGLKERWRSAKVCLQQELLHKNNGEPYDDLDYWRGRASELFDQMVSAGRVLDAIKIAI